MSRTDKKDQQRYWGEWLSRSIANSGKNQSELAEYVGVSDPQVTRWKKGSAPRWNPQSPSAEACNKIADFFSVDRLRLAVTAGRIPTETAGVDRLPLPDDYAQRMAERQAIQDIITKRVSRERDRQVLLHVLEALKVRDSMEGLTSEEKLAEAMQRTDRTLRALEDLLKPDNEGARTT